MLTVLIKKIFTVSTGFVLRGILYVAIGLFFMLPFVPGPGTPFLIVGLFYLSKRYIWAKTALFKVLYWLDRFLKLGKRWKGRLCNRYPHAYHKVASISHRSKGVYHHRLSPWFSKNFPKFFTSCKEICRNIQIDKHLESARREYTQSKSKKNDD